MDEQQHPQRRRHRRYPFVLRVEYSDGEDFYCEWTENLSAGGLFVRTERTFSLGEELRLSLSFPGLLDPVELAGRVAWIREASPIQAGGIGVEVTRDDARRRLAELAVRATLAHKLDVKQPFKVLVVEDNPRVVRSYERVLKHLSAVAGGRIELVFCGNGHSALSVLKRQEIDLVITDIYMPVMDGFTLIERVREDPSLARLPVIVITGGRADERQRAERMGVSAFLHKPVQFGQILETIVWLAGQIAEAEARAELAAALGECQDDDLH